MIDHHVRVVLGQVSVSGKTNEITAFAPLLGTLTSIDLTGVVFTADALHTQREHVEELHRRGAHWLLTVKGNQPTLRRQLAALPWKQLEVAHRQVVSTGTDAGRSAPSRWSRSPEGIAFPRAAQAVQITRKTRAVNARASKPGRWRTETVYAITDLPPHHARPDELATWARGHWQIEALHWIRDVTFGEDLSQVHTSNAPQVMASLPNLVISLHRLAGATNIAAALRHHARDGLRPLRLIKII